MSGPTGRWGCRSAWRTWSVPRARGASPGCWPGRTAGRRARHASPLRDDLDPRVHARLRAPNRPGTKAARAHQDLSAGAPVGPYNLAKAVKTLVVSLLCLLGAGALPAAVLVSFA